MGVGAMFLEALIFPLRRMGWVLVILFGGVAGYIEHLELQRPESLIANVLSIFLMISTLILFDLRAATLTTMGGNHLLATPGGPWGKALIATGLLLVPFFILSAALLIGITYTLTPLASEESIPANIVGSILGILFSCYAGPATAAVIGDNSLRGLYPRRAWEVIKKQPKLCLVYFAVSAPSVLLLTDSGTSPTLIILGTIVAIYLGAVSARLLGRMAIGYRAASPVLP